MRELGALEAGCLPAMAESRFRQEQKAAEDAIKLISEAPAPPPVIVVDDKNHQDVLADAEAQMAAHLAAVAAEAKAAEAEEEMQLDTVPEYIQQELGPPPMLEDALVKVRGITKRQLWEVQSLSRPPAILKLVLEPVIVSPPLPPLLLKLHELLMLVVFCSLAAVARRQRKEGPPRLGK